MRGSGVLTSGPSAGDEVAVVVRRKSVFRLLRQREAVVLDIGVCRSADQRRRQNATGEYVLAGQQISVGVRIVRGDLLGLGEVRTGCSVGLDDPFGEKIPDLSPVLGT